MIARFPWVEGELGEDGNGLVHLEVAALRRGVEAAANDQDAEKALAILGFIDDLYRQPLELHPDVLNALDVSFVEDLLSLRTGNTIVRGGTPWGSDESPLGRGRQVPPLTLSLVDQLAALCNGRIWRGQANTGLELTLRSAYPREAFALQLTPPGLHLCSRSSNPRR
jgi:hypothetical protein